MSGSVGCIVAAEVAGPWTMSSCTGGTAPAPATVPSEVAFRLRGGRPPAVMESSTVSGRVRGTAPAKEESPLRRAEPCFASHRKLFMIKLR